jgi:hypothetical protein
MLSLMQGLRHGGLEDLLELFGLMEGGRHDVRLLLQFLPTSF